MVTRRLHLSTIVAAPLEPCVLSAARSLANRRHRRIWVVSLRRRHGQPAGGGASAASSMVGGSLWISNLRTPGAARLSAMNLGGPGAEASCLNKVQSIDAHRHGQAID